jgi:RNA polymerase sigma-70 factor (ECF subfamily)
LLDAWNGTVDESQRGFEMVVAPYLSDAITLAQLLTKNRTDAEDVVQEACLRAYRSMKTYAGGNPRAWVLAIVRNTAISWIEKNRPAGLVLVDGTHGDEWNQLEAAGDWTTWTPANPETEMIARATAAELEAAISALPLKLREPLVLRDIQGLEYREIASVVGIPIGTVMSRLARARRALINALKDVVG